jgi:hypothetical protein
LVVAEEKTHPVLLARRDHRVRLVYRGHPARKVLYRFSLLPCAYSSLKKALKKTKNAIKV